jgi:hypothetical protein
MFSVGCAEGRSVAHYARPADALVILDFGRPMHRWGHYGASLFGRRFHPTYRIRGAAQAYARGYVHCSRRRPRAHLRLGIGTSNYGPGVTRRHGRAWATMVNMANGWLQRRGLSSRVDIVGASDIELSWNRPAVSRRWVRGYDAMALWPYYDYGDAAGCPPKGNCYGRWTLEDVWYVAWGAHSAWPLPEIYTKSGISARQWFHLSLYSHQRHGSPMAFVGVMSERGSCRHFPRWCRGLNNSPFRAWKQLHHLVNSDQRTAQPIRWSTDIR